MLTRAATLPLVLVAAVSLARVADDPDDARVLARLDRQPTQTAFDEAFAHFQDRGRADELEARYRKRADGGDPKAAVVVGLFHLRAGRDADAAAAFRTADAALPSDPVPPRLLGEALTRLGRRDEAAQALGRALDRKPPRAEMLAAATALSRLHARAGKPDLARAVWQKVEAAWPDPETRERVAQALVEDGQHAEALARYEALAKAEPVAGRRLKYRVLAADLHARLGNKPAAVAGYEACLADVAPGDFRAADLRRRLEDVFLRTEDRAGLEVYYRTRLTQRPDDTETVGRLARLAADRGDPAEARRLLTAGLEKAPKDVPLRRQLIDQLERDSDDAAAAAECEHLDKVAANDPDTLARWGRLLLRTGKPDAAAAVWRRLLPATDKPADAAAIGRVADLFRQAGRADDALALYRRAAAAAPEDPLPREALGEFLLATGKPAEALAAWRELAAGPRRTPANLARLSDLLADFNCPAEAAAAAVEAIELKPDDFALRLKLADRLAVADRPADAAAAAAEAGRRAATPEETLRALDVRLRALRAAGTLAAEADALRKQLTPASSGADWFRLARHEEEARRWPEATAALSAAVTKEADLAAAGLLMPALVASARVAEQAGDLGAAAEAARKLVTRDPRNRADHLRRVARLESRRSRPEPAVAAAEELVADGPTDPERHRFLAQIAFEVGDREKGLAALRSAARTAPNDPDTLAALATTLADQFRPAEAMDLAWRAFDKAPPERKPALARKLADLALRVNRADRLADEIERRLNPGDAFEARRVAALCVAQAHQAGGNLPAARRQLERLLPERPDDRDLVAQLSELAEQEGDLAAALGYQRQLVRLSGAAAETRLTMLLLRAGEVEEAVAMWGRKGRTTKDVTRQLELLDNLIFFGRYVEALSLASAAVRERPADWELLYRRGLAEAHLGRAADAAATFRALLKVPLPDDTRAGATPPDAKDDADEIVRDRKTAAARVREVVGMQSGSAGSRDKELWTPADFGQARMAALGWLCSLAERGGTLTAFLAELRDRRGPPDAADLRGWWDWWYLHAVMSDDRETTAAEDVLRRTGLNAFEYWCLGYWHDELFRPDRLDERIAGFRRLLARKPGWADADCILHLRRGLRAAGREAEAGPLYRELLAAVPNREAVVERAMAAARFDDVAAVVELIGKFDVSAKGWEFAVGGLVAEGQGFTVHLERLIARRAAAGATDDVLRLLGAFLDANRRRRAADRTGGPPPDRRPNPLGLQQYTLGAYSGELVIDHPRPGGVFDGPTLHLLGAAAVVARQAAFTDDLLDLAAARAAAAPPDAVAAERVLAFALRWWAGERTAALVELKRACDAAPADDALRADYARAAAALGKPADGLAVLDAHTPTGADGLRVREWVALALAKQAGDAARARLAAERLADLRLPAEEQLELAGELARLGLTDKAQAVADRTRAGAGGSVEVLVPVMRQLAATGRGPEAAEAAFAVLRVVPAPAAPEADARRDEALRVLHQLGKLDPLVARAEARRKAAPKAAAVLNELAEFYRAAGRAADELAATEQSVLLRPDDAAARFALGRRYVEAGNHPAGIAHMTAAIRTHPRLFYSHTSDVIRIFAAARELPRLTATLLEVDARSLYSGDVAQLAGQLWANEDQRPVAVKLLARVWKPGQGDESGLGSFLSSGNRQDNRWAFPGVFELATARLVTDPVPPTVGPWDAFGSLSAAFLAEAARADRLPAVLDALTAAVGKRSDWAAGRALRAAALVRLGRAGEARPVLADALRAAAPDRLTDSALKALTDEFAGPEFADLVAPLLEARLRAVAAQDVIPQVDTALLDAYLRTAKRTGRTAAAKAALLGMVDRVELGRTSVIRTSGGQTFTMNEGGNRGEVAARLVGLGEPAAAVPAVFPAWREVTEMVAAARDNDSPARTYFIALEMLRSDTTGDAVVSLLAGRPRVELHPVVLGPGRVRLRGPVSDAVAQAVAPAAADRVAARLEELLREHPDDFALLAVLAALRAARGDTKAADALAAWVRANPLDALPPGSRPRAAHRRQAAAQLTAWLPAAVCLKSPAGRATGEVLAERALAAADRLADPRAAQAVLQEWLELDAARDDRAGAEARWAAVFDRLVPPPAAGELPTRVSAETFARVVNLATAAAEQGHPRASVRAVRAALAGGLPAGDEQYRATPDVRAKVQALEELWRKARVPAAELYTFFAAVVLPESDPAAVLEDFALAPRGTTMLGDALVALARESGQVPDLTAKLTARLANPGAAPRARVLLARLAAATRDTALAREQLEWGRRQAGTKTLALGGAWALLAPFLRHPELDAPAREVLIAAAEAYRQGRADATDDGLSLEIARSYLRAGDLPMARKYLAEYADSADSTNRTAARRAFKAAVVAVEWTDAGQWPDAWAAAATAADLRADGAADNGSGGQAGDTLVVQNLLRRLSIDLAARPPAERYARLREWVLPPVGKPRFLAAAFGPRFDTPAAEGPLPPAVGTGRYPLPSGYGQPTTAGVIDTFTWLVEAAAAADRLPDLAAAVGPLAEKGIERAGHLRLLVLLRAGDHAAAAEAFKSQAGGRAATDRTASGRMLTVLVAARAVAAEPSRAWGEQLAAEARGWGTDRSPGMTVPQAAALFDALAGPVPPLPPGGPFRTWSVTGRGWAATEGHLVARPGAGALRLAVPLAGDFEFSFEVSGSAQVLYGGYVFAAGRRNRPGTDDDEDHATPPAFPVELFSRHTLRVRGGRVALLSGDRGDAPEVAVKPNLPLLFLAPTADTEPVVFRNLALAGSPQVPATVPLIGASADWTYEAIESPPEPDIVPGPPPRPTLNDPTWEVRDGVLTGRRVAPVRTAPTYYLYEPLADGETFAYEFFHQPGTAGVHPALGDLAFVLTAEGVRLHWKAAVRGPKLDLRPGATVAGPADHRRGPAALPLKPGEWNAVAVTLRGRTAELTLNGELVYAHPLDDGYDPAVGVFYRADQEEARVRSAVLRGTWPKSPPADLTAPRVPTDRAARAWIDEDALAEGGAREVRRVLARPAAERFAALKAWVLQAPDRPGFRVRAWFGADGEFVSPVGSLLAAAAELGKLDEVAAPPGRPAGWDALVALAAGRDADAVAALDRLAPAGAKPTEAEQWVAYQAGRAALERPGTRAAAGRLLGRLAAGFEKPRTPLAFHVLAAAAPAPTGVPLARPVVSGGADGLPPPRWVRDGDTLRAMPGAPYSTATAAVPLFGDAEVTFELDTAGGAPLGVQFAGADVRLRADGRQAFRVAPQGGLSPLALDPPLTGIDGKLSGAARVRGGRVVIELGGRVVIDEPLDGPADAPRWWGFSAVGGRGGAVRLLGVKSPGQAPPSVALLPPPADGFEPRYRTDFSLADRTFHLGRSVGGYSRPLPAKAVVEYEFFHDPGRSGVWPVVGAAVPPADPAALPAFAWVRVTVDVRGAEAVVAYDGKALPPRKLDDERTIGLTTATGAAAGAVRGAKLTVGWPVPARPGEWFDPGG